MRLTDRLLVGLVLAALAGACAIANTAWAVPPGPPEDEGTTPTVEVLVNAGVIVDVPKLPAAAPPATTAVADACDTASAAAQVRGGGFSLAFPTYPCAVLRTYAAIDATQGKGFFLGKVPRVFLRARLITLGLFSTIFGLVGLG